MKKINIKSTTLICLVSLYFATVLNLSFWRYITHNIQIDSPMMLLFALSLGIFIFVPLYVLFNFLICPYVGKLTTTILLLGSAAANYYMFADGIYIDSDMVRNIMETNPRETMEHMSSSFWLYVIITGLFPAVLLLMTNIQYQTTAAEFKQRLKYVGCSLFAVLLMGGICYKEYAVVGRNHNKVTKLVNTLNYTYSFVRYCKKKAETKREFAILDANPKVKISGRKKLLVLFIGETARAQNFSLNGYYKETNPLLQKQDIVYFSNVASCGTMTAVSLPCMFSAYSRKNFDTDDAAYTQNLLDIMQTAGYNIEWIDNDNGCKGVCNRVPTENMFSKCKGGICYDDVLLQKLAQMVKNIKQNTLLVLHMIGSHGPAYYERYPQQFAKFIPDCRTSDIQSCSKEEIVNTYNNTILYSDYIISSAIDILKNNQNKQRDDSLIYVSDHGESLGENNTYLHGLPYAFAPETQKQVPMLFWFSKNMKKEINSQCLQQKSMGPHSHDNLFHTVLGLAEVQTHLYQADMDITSDCRQNALAAK